MSEFAIVEPGPWPAAGRLVKCDHCEGVARPIAYHGERCVDLEAAWLPHLHWQCVDCRGTYVTRPADWKEGDTD